MIYDIPNVTSAYRDPAWQYEATFVGDAVDRGDYARLAELAVISHLDPASESVETPESVDAQTPQDATKTKKSRDTQGPLHKILLIATILIAVTWLTAAMEFRSHARD